jgi:hypothetical protein
MGGRSVTEAIPAAALAGPLREVCDESIRRCFSPVFHEALLKPRDEDIKLKLRDFKSSKL